jgi:long-chain fatty acid transport protein
VNQWNPVLVRMATLACLSAPFLALPAQATNGLIPIGFGTESVAMGGADLAVSRDTSAMNANPAGLTQISGKRLDLDQMSAFALDVGHADEFGNDVTVANDRIFAGTLGYAQHLADRPLWWGTGLFLQGASGVEYPRLATAFGTTDELTSLFTVLRLDLSAAARLSPSVSIGASLGVTRSALEQRVFPNTSAAGPPAFFGYRLHGMRGYAFGPKVGLLAKVSPNARLGVAYTAPISADMKHGRLATNQSAIGLGTVTYRDVTATGINLPTEVGVGYAVDVTPHLLLSLEADWIDWSNAVDTATLTARQPDNPGAAPTVVLVADHKWRDQYVVAAGLAYAPSAEWTFYAGYNQARNPIPPDHLTPLLAAIAERHATAGLSHRLGAHWRVLAALEYTLGNEVTYTNTALPFGPDARETLRFVVAHATLSREW